MSASMPAATMHSAAAVHAAAAVHTAAEATAAPAVEAAWTGASEAAWAHKGMSVELGLRPTDLSIGPARPGELSLAGSVSRVEYGGADVFVDLALGTAERLRIRASPENPVATGNRIEARIALSALHLFDADGISLRRPNKDGG